jgi:general secretion pathway protein E
MEKNALDRILNKVDPSKILSADGKLSIPDSARRVSTAKRRTLGEILIDRNKISRDDLLRVLRTQQETKQRLGEILIAEEIIDQAELYRALAEQFDLAFFDALPANDIDPDLVSNIQRSFCLQNRIVPVSRDNYGLTVAISDPLNLAPVDDLRLIVGTPIFRIMSPSNVIEAAINSVYERQDMSEGTTSLKQEEEDTIDGLDNVHDLLDDSEEAPVRREVSLIIRRAVAERASDIHIEPYEDKLVVRIRVDGSLKELRTIPKKFQSSVTTRIKILGRLDIAESRIPQDGRIPLKVGGRECDVRLSTLPTKWGERIVMRILDKSAGIRELEKLNIPDRIYKQFEQCLRQEHGILLVTGPTGSGKTSTLASALMHVNRPDVNIITIEDPVEIVIPGTSQVEVNEKAGLTFAAALRSILRQDPNIILIQEIRDAETAQIAVAAAITGHLVLSTLHTNDTATSITRLTDLGVEGYKIASSVIGVLAVRLVRTVCHTCREPVEHTEAELAELGITLEQARKHKTFRARPTGCPSCKNSGYAGRVGIYEFLHIDEQVRSYILKSADGAGLKRLAVQKGMMTLRECAALRFLSGLTTLADTVSATQIESEEEG